MEVKNRLINYYKNNGFIQKYVKGMDLNTNEIILSYNDIKKNISIDALENITSEEEVISFLNDTNLKEEQVIGPEIDTVEPKVISSDLDRETLNDIKILTEIKSKSGLDNLLKDFAINESTGLIDINKAIDIVEKNTIEEVVKSIKEHHDFDLNLENYDKTGKFIGQVSFSNRSDDEIIASSFNNVKVYLEAANMYVEQANFSEDDINKKLSEYINKVKEILNPPKKVEKPVVNNLIANNEPVVAPKSAGFADIFVLCVIVLVYAIIIVNLILKLI